MNGKFMLAWLLLLAAPVMGARAQDGDLISDVGGSNDGEEDDGGWSYEPPCSDPDTRPPVIYADRKLTNITVQCFKDVPGVPIVWAIDKCDGDCDVEPNLPDPSGTCPTIIYRAWTSTDTKGNSKTRSETITVHDTNPPVINIPAEITLEAEKCGTAILPNFLTAKRVTDNCCLKYVSQTPEGGSVTNKVDDEFPVTIEASDDCNTTSKTFTVKVVCQGCGSCSPGSGDPQDKSIHLDLNLGQLADGRTAGHLSLYTEHPTERIFTPDALFYDRESNGATTLRDANGCLRQIRSADVLVDIVTNNGFFCSYDIQLYSPSDWGVPDETGLYAPAGVPFLSWRVYAPRTLSFEGKVNGDPRHVVLVKMQRGAQYVRYDYDYDESQMGWTLTSGRTYNHNDDDWDNGLKIEVRSSEWDAEHLLRTENYFIKDILGEVTYREENVYRQFPWGEARVKTTQGEGASARVAERGYYEDPLLPDRYARLAWERHPDGNFTWRDYDANGRVVMEARAWKDAEVPTLESNVLLASSAVTLYDFAPTDPADDGSVSPWEPRVVTELVAGTVVAKTYYSYVAAANGEVTKIQEQCVSPTSSFGAADNLRTITVYYSNEDAFWSGQVKSVEYPDGRLDRYVLERGAWVTNGETAEFSPLDTGDHLRTTLIHGTTLHPEGLGNTTREVSVRPILGEDILRKTYVYTGGTNVCADWTRREFDERGHLVAEHYANGLSHIYGWSDCCGKESDTDVDGVLTLFAYDVLGRVETQTKMGVPRISADPGYAYQSSIITSNRYNASGNILQVKRAGAIIEENNYDLSGSLVETLDSSGLITQYASSEGGRVATVVRPGGATEITENYPDGQVKSITDTGVMPRFHDYGVNPDGSKWTTVRTGASNSPIWEKTTTDMLGRTVRMEKPGFGGVVRATTYDYNNQGQLTAVRQWQGDNPAVPAGVATLFEYDELGDQIRTVQDVNGNGLIDLEGPDRVQETQVRIVTISGKRWRETRSKTYPQQGSSNSVVLAIQRQQIEGEGSGAAYVSSESVDNRGNTNRTTYTVDPVKKIVTVIQNPPDSTVDAVTIHRNGLLHSTRPAVWRDPTYYAYDYIGRVVKVTDPRTGPQYTEYNERNQVVKTWDVAGQITRYGYDENTGLKIAVTDALGQVTYTAYDLQGRPTNVWGATYPVAYEYDSYGRMAAMKTWRDTNSESDVTRWFYDEATGLLTNKVYADGSGPGYEYDAAGRLIKRTWARGITTEYAYDSLGQMTNINYSDGTPDVSFTYDRMGRQVSVTDVLGTRTNVYDPVTLNLVSEQMPGGQALARSYDRYGRPAGIELGDGYRATYSYDDVSRFTAITTAVNAVTTAVKYAYLAQSDLISGWLARGAGDTGYLEVQRYYERNRDLVSTVLVANATGDIARYDYVNDQLGRRIARNDILGGAMISNNFGYNGCSELDAAVMGTNQFGYQYDAIGNRQVVFANDQTVEYVANALNQYASVLPSAGTPAYDADGNMTSDGTLAYSWDAENRLVEVLSNGTAIVRNAYDFMGRRVRKATVAATNMFLYDGWNSIAEFGPATNYYLWGLDLSGTLQSAGGVGGLFCQIQNGDGAPDRLLFSFCDANGNVTGLVETNGDVVARYDYDPFGNLIAHSGIQAAVNPFRFSNKYSDDETSLYYFGYRFYSPTLGRWTSRDPVEESGGINAYCIADNDIIGQIDILGMWVANVHYNETANWADMFKKTHRTEIARADNATDDGSTGPKVTIGRHMRQTKGGGDSRFWYYRDELKKAGDALAKQKCKEASTAFGQGLHSLQDMSTHRPWPIFLSGGDWPKTYRTKWNDWHIAAHPGWWDYYSTDIWAVAADAPNLRWKYDTLWWEHGRNDSDYYPWVGSFWQRLSQVRAQAQVRQDSLDALSHFANIVRSSCCAIEMLVTP